MNANEEILLRMAAPRGEIQTNDELIPLYYSVFVPGEKENPMK